MCRARPRPAGQRGSDRKALLYRHRSDDSELTEQRPTKKKQVRAWMPPFAPRFVMLCISALPCGCNASCNLQMPKRMVQQRMLCIKEMPSCTLCHFVLQQVYTPCPSSCVLGPSSALRLDAKYPKHTRRILTPPHAHCSITPPTHSLLIVIVVECVCSVNASMCCSAARNCGRPNEMPTDFAPRKTHALNSLNFTHFVCLSADTETVPPCRRCSSLCQRASALEWRSW